MSGTFKIIWMCFLISSGNLVSKAEVCHKETALAAKHLDWKVINILNAGDPNQPLPGLIRSLSFNNISASVIVAEKYRWKDILDLTYKIILVNPSSDMDMVSNIIQKRGSGWSNLLVSNAPKTTAAIEQKLSSLVLYPRGVFLLQCGQESQIWMLQTTVGDRGLVKNKWTVGPSGKYIENFNQQGLELYISTLPWRPYMDMYECNDNKQHCRSQGAIPDVFEQLGRMFNFTWRYDVEPSSKWGVVPVTGTWQDPNATFEGMLGSMNLLFDIFETFYLLQVFMAEL